MSQDKTIIPGMRMANNLPNQGKMNNFYQPTPDNKEAISANGDTQMDPSPKTMVSPNGLVGNPGASTRVAEAKDTAGNTKVDTNLPPQNVAPAAAPQPQTKEIRRPAIYIQDRPIVGMLVSTSNGGKMELFPLYLGRNIIGRSKKADVMLNEETVSEEHAIIVIRLLLQPVERYIATLTDQDSSCGTYINGESTDFDTHILEDRDTIQFGMGYQTMFIKLDAKELGLKACPSFKPTAMPPAEPLYRNNATMVNAGERKVNQGISVLEGVVKRQETAAPNSFNPYTPDRDDEEPRTVLYR